MWTIRGTHVLKILSLAFSYPHTFTSMEEIWNPRSEKTVWMERHRLNMPPLKSKIQSSWFPQSIPIKKATNLSLKSPNGAVLSLVFEQFQWDLQDILVTFHIARQNLPQS